MSVETLVDWLIVASWLIVLALIVFGPLVRALREARRIISRIGGIIDNSPLPLQLAKAEGDVLRVEVAIGRLPLLQQRALTAVAVVRSTPIVPQAFVAIATRISTEIDAFKRART